MDRELRKEGDGGSLEPQEEQGASCDTPQALLPCACEPVWAVSSCLTAATSC